MRFLSFVIVKLRRRSSFDGSTAHDPPTPAASCLKACARRATPEPFFGGSIEYAWTWAYCRWGVCHAT